MTQSCLRFLLQQNIEYWFQLSAWNCFVNTTGYILQTSNDNSKHKVHSRVLLMLILENMTQLFLMLHWIVGDIMEAGSGSDALMMMMMMMMLMRGRGRSRRRRRTLCRCWCARLKFRTLTGTQDFFGAPFLSACLNYSKPHLFLGFRFLYSLFSGLVFFKEWVNWSWWARRGSTFL